MKFRGVSNFHQNTDIVCMFFIYPSEQEETMPLGDGALHQKLQLYQMDDEASTDLDTEKEKKECKRCITLEKALESMEQSQEALILTAKRFGEDIRHWERKYVTLEKRSNEITAKMAGVLEDSGNLENVNDQYANTRLAKRFEDMYVKQWTDLSEWLHDNIEDMTELARIKTLTSLMNHAYDECHKTADSQLRKFLFLEEGDMLPLPQEDPELYRLRRKNGQAKKIRTTVKKKIARKILRSKDADKLINLIEDKKDEVKGKLTEFFEEFIDILWLMSISHPVLLLNFDVVGKHYSGKIKERFTQYSCQDTVVDKTLAKNDVVAVVWPSVELENGEGLCAKGDIITVKDGKSNSEVTEKERQQKDDNSNSDSVVVQKQSENCGCAHVGLSTHKTGNENVKRPHDEEHKTDMFDKEDEFEDVDLN